MTPEITYRKKTGIVYYAFDAPTGETREFSPTYAQSVVHWPDCEPCEVKHLKKGKTWHKFTKRRLDGRFQR